MPVAGYDSVEACEPAPGKPVVSGRAKQPYVIPHGTAGALVIEVFRRDVGLRPKQ
jgi:hypothetical protein